MSKPDATPGYVPPLVDTGEPSTGPLVGKVIAVDPAQQGADQTVTAIGTLSKGSTAAVVGETLFWLNGQNFKAIQQPDGSYFVPVIGDVPATVTEPPVAGLPYGKWLYCHACKSVQPAVIAGANTTTVKHKCSTCMSPFQSSVLGKIVSLSLDSLDWDAAEQQQIAFAESRGRKFQLEFKQQQVVAAALPNWATTIVDGVFNESPTWNYLKAVAEKPPKSKDDIWWEAVTGKPKPAPVIGYSSPSPYTISTPKHGLQPTTVAIPILGPGMTHQLAYIDPNAFHPGVVTKVTSYQSPTTLSHDITLTVDVPMQVTVSVSHEEMLTAKQPLDLLEAKIKHAGDMLKYLLEQMKQQFPKAVDQSSSWGHGWDGPMHDSYTNYGQQWKAEQLLAKLEAESTKQHAEELKQAKEQAVLSKAKQLEQLYNHAMYQQTQQQLAMAGAAAQKELLKEIDAIQKSKAEQTLAAKEKALQRLEAATKNQQAVAKYKQFKYPKGGK